MAKRTLYILILSLFIHFKLSAQETIITEINTPLLQKYIDMAKQYYPRKKVFAENVIAAKSRIQTAAMGYLEALNASYFYRPSNGTTIDANNPYIINGFQLGINLNLGTFLKTPSLVKQSKQALKVAELEDKEYNITLENQVKNRYFEYLQTVAELKLKTQALTDNKSVSDNTKYRFEKGEVPLDVYNSARSATTISSSEKLNAELNLLRAKVALEELIGEKLEAVK